MDSEASDGELQSAKSLLPYEFRKLSKSNATRLLKLQPGDVERSEIVCELVEAPSDDQEKKTPYEALSWAWGTAPKTARIRIQQGDENFVFPVQPSLEQALKALRLQRKTRTLWVDAICINQDNKEEKNHQVPMMNKIYGKSKRVCVWLGEGDEASSTAINFIKKDVLKLQHFDELCENQAAASQWKAMLDLMKRPWFSRRWVVQEIALATDARVYCGKNTIAWKDFADAVQLFVEVESATHRLSEVMKKDPSFFHLPGWFEYVSALGASLLVNATGTLFRTSKDKSQPLLSLEYLVSHLSVFGVSDPHDTIYALLAIAKDTAPYAISSTDKDVPGRTLIERWAKDHQEAQTYHVDYRKPFVDICKDFIEFAIHQSNKSDPVRALDILCRPWAPASENMPSWIARLSGAAYALFQHPSSEFRMGRKNADPLVGLPFPDPRYYTAAETKTADLETLRFKKRDKYHSLYASGFVLDVVGNVEVASQGGNVPSTWVKAAKWEWRDGVDPPDDFWRTLVADRDRRGRNPPTYFRRACKESIAKGLDSGSLNTTALIDEGRCSVVAEYFRRVQAVIWNRSLMRTEHEKRLGIVHSGVKEGDLVCILYGCSVPVILRKNVKTDEEVLKEQNEDRKEQEEKKQADELKEKQDAALRIFHRWQFYKKKPQEYREALRRARREIRKSDIKEEWEGLKEAVTRLPMPAQCLGQNDLVHKDMGQYNLVQKESIQQDAEQELAAATVDQTTKDSSQTSKGSRTGSLDPEETIQESSKPTQISDKTILDSIQGARDSEQLVHDSDQLAGGSDMQIQPTCPVSNNASQASIIEDPGLARKRILGRARRKKSVPPRPRVPQTDESRLISDALASSVSKAGKLKKSLQVDDSCWYEFIGGCYVHGMMDGEAIKFQNDTGAKVEVCELR